ncbi:MAG: hypothetical protein IPK76_03815 [Lewinellaceae bacterium]|nr:hypothetical protein [Lewinellaceae bacterium]
MLKKQMPFLESEPALWGIKKATPMKRWLRKYDQMSYAEPQVQFSSGGLMSVQNLPIFYTAVVSTITAPEFVTELNWIEQGE